MNSDKRNSVDQREKEELSFLSLFLTLSLFRFLLCFFFLSCSFPLFFYFPLLSLICGPHGATCTLRSRFRFYLKTIYFFSVQFILIELGPNHFLTFEIFVKISSLKSLTPPPIKFVKIQTISKFDEPFSGH